MKRKWTLGILIFLIAGLILVCIGFLVKNENSDQQTDVLLDDTNSDDLDKDNIDGSMIKGTIVRVDTSYLLVNDGSLWDIPISDDTIIYVDGEEADISKIKLGQTVEVTYSGVVLERYPGVAVDVTKICATTEDVSLLAGTVLEVDKQIMQIQYGENSKDVCKMSISKETFVCMHGMDYGIESIEVGQNVEVVYKNGTDEELPSVTIVLVK